ncbi:MgtC/SapB family protein [Dokdonella sp.]|uniref:MgtC/SapB family protein n=1 Tax=Dokdonella sp. TaxID=2291710 RepID=UPI003AF8067D
MAVIDWISPGLQGQGWVYIGHLVLALVLTSLIGLERELKMKSAGLRTQALVGVAAALIVLVSKYGFSDVLVPYRVVLDPSRVAAQIVSGIGFIGGGLIFVHRDTVRGLTTAAIVWLSAAIGMACGAGLPILAVFVTATHFVVIYGYTPLVRRILEAQVELLVHYAPGRGAVQEVMQLCTGRGFSVHEVRVIRADVAGGDAGDRAIRLQLQGRGRIEALAVAVGDIEGVSSVRMIRGDHY